jgi:hypothetical protein
MMRKLFGGALFLAMLLAFAGIGNAVNFEFEDVYKPHEKVFLDFSGETYSFYHNITDDGFQPASHTIVDADIYLTFVSNDEWFEDFLTFFFEEYISFTFDGSPQGYQEIDTGKVHLGVNAQLLQSDGKVQVTLANLGSGDVWFDKSQLNVEATPTPTPTPEPGSLLLLGSGLAGLGFIGRKRLGAKRVEAL